MAVRQPAEAGKLFETLFAAGDLEGLMALYEPDAVFTNARGAHAGSDAIRNVLQGYLNTGASIRMNESVAFEAGDLALVHWSWTMAFPTAEAQKTPRPRPFACRRTAPGGSSSTTPMGPP